jgi:hypothetical protein
MMVGTTYPWLIYLVYLLLLGDSGAPAMQDVTRPNNSMTANPPLSAAHQTHPQQPPNAVPTIRLDKSRFALGESVFLWVGVEAKSRDPIPKQYQNACRLTIILSLLKNPSTLVG